MTDPSSWAPVRPAAWSRPGLARAAFSSRRSCVRMRASSSRRLNGLVT